MPSILAPSVVRYRNPQFKPGLDALVLFLMERDYTTLARWHIYDHVAVHGTMAGCAYLDPADEAAAEEAFVDALPALPLDSDAWDRDESVIFDAELLAAGNHPWPIPVVSADDDRLGPDDEWPNLDSLAAAAALEDLALPPIAGGAPERTDDDIDREARDHAEWLQQVDGSYPPDDQVEPVRPRLNSALDPATLGRIRLALWGPIGLA